LSGAEALGLDQEVGSLAVGKKADLLLLNSDSPALLSGGDPIDLVVYSGGPEHVESVYIEGVRRAHRGQVSGWDAQREAGIVRSTAKNVAARAAL